MSGPPPMAPLRGRTLLAVAAVVGVVAYAGLSFWEGSGRSPLPLPWTSVAAMLVLAVAVLVAGWPVRRWTRGDRSRRLDPLRAARTVVLARAAALAGSALAGLHAAQALLAAPLVDIEPRRERLVLALVAVTAAVLMVVAGLVVERWCRLPDDEDERGGGALPGPRPERSPAA